MDVNDITTKELGGARSTVEKFIHILENIYMNRMLVEMWTDHASLEENKEEVGYNG